MRMKTWARLSAMHREYAPEGATLAEYMAIVRESNHVPDKEIAKRLAVPTHYIVALKDAWREKRSVRVHLTEETHLVLRQAAIVAGVTIQEFAATSDF